MSFTERDYFKKMAGLQALAERPGTAEEGKAARGAMERLKGRYPHFEALRPPQRYSGPPPRSTIPGPPGKAKVGETVSPDDLFDEDHADFLKSAMRGDRDPRRDEPFAESDLLDDIGVTVEPPMRERGYTRPTYTDEQFRREYEHEFIPEQNTCLICSIKLTDGRKSHWAGICTNCENQARSDDNLRRLRNEPDIIFLR